MTVVKTVQKWIYFLLFVQKVQTVHYYLFATVILHLHRINRYVIELISEKKKEKKKSVKIYTNKVIVICMKKHVHSCSIFDLFALFDEQMQYA